MQLTIEVPDHTTAAAWETYPDRLVEQKCWSGADIIRAMIVALKEKEAADAEREAAERAERERERFIIDWPTYLALGLLNDTRIETTWLGNPSHTPNDAWYEITNPEALGLTSYKPVVLPEPLPPLYSYIEPSQIRNGMKVDVEEETRDMAKGSSRKRYTTGTITEHVPGARNIKPKVGGIRIQLADRNDADVKIYFFGMDENVEAAA